MPTVRERRPTSIHSPRLADATAIAGRLPRPPRALAYPDQVFRHRLLTALLGAATLSACTQSATPVTTSVDPSGSVHTVTTRPTSTPTPTPKIDFIRATKFGEQQWQDVIQEQKPKLTGGKGEADGFSYALGSQAIVYADADGDGLEDALVPLSVTGPGGTVVYLYIWTWDAKQHQAVQLADPVGQYSACGHSLTSTAPGIPMGFQISEALRDVYDNQACGTPPAHAFTRTVGVDHGGLVMTKPVLGYGGICYQTYRDPSTLDQARSVKVAPDATAPEAASAKNLYHVVPDYADARSWGDGWVQVSWRTEEMAKKGLDRGVCGFVWQK